MSERTPADQIEAIVGVPRHALKHYGRAVSAEQRVYILHSEACRDAHQDLRACDYSHALDRGIDIDEWVEDQPTLLAIENGWLIPDPFGEDSR